MCITPTLPAHWPGFSAEITIENTHYTIVVKAEGLLAQQDEHILLDSVPLPAGGTPLRIPLTLDGGQHRVELTLATPTSSE